MAPAPAGPPIAAWRWGVVGLLFLATLINYTDRLALAGTQRYLLNEFEPDPAKHNQVYADVQFAFSVSFAVFQLLAGFLVDRLSLRWLYVGAILVWSGAGLATGYVPAGAMGALTACRVLLGFGEAFNWPCAVACVERVIPRESRGFANGVFHSGASIGAVLTPFLVMALVVNTSDPARPDYGVGWRTVFIAVGALGFAWVGLWLALTRGPRAAAIDRIDSGPAPALWRVLATRPFAICLASSVGVNLCWHFYNQWFPRYLTQELEFSGRGEQYTLAGFYLAADAGSVGFGYLTRALVGRGLTVERARQVVMTSLAAVVLAATAGAVSSPAVGVKLALFYAVAAGVMGGYSVVFALVQDVSPRHTAQLLGVCGCVAWLAISGVTKFAGGYAQPGNYATLFLDIAAAPAAAALAGWFWPRPATAPAEVT